jgi:hypothetical protein
LSALSMRAWLADENQRITRSGQGGATGHHYASSSIGTRSRARRHQLRAGAFFRAAVFRFAELRKRAK